MQPDAGSHRFVGRSHPGKAARPLPCIQQVSPELPLSPSA
jgi:hypothetical protein